MAEITTIAESWNGHTKGEVENHIKSRFSDKVSTSDLEDNELTLMTAFASNLSSVDSHLSQHTVEISAALAETESVLMIAYASLADRVTILENNNN